MNQQTIFSLSFSVNLINKSLRFVHSFIRKGEREVFHLLVYSQKDGSQEPRIPTSLPRGCQAQASASSASFPGTPTGGWVRWSKSRRDLIWDAGVVIAA